MEVLIIHISTELLIFGEINILFPFFKGILHLYKENSTTSLEEGVLRSQMICMIGVPAKHKTRDLLQVCIIHHIIDIQFHGKNISKYDFENTTFITVHCTMSFRIGNDEIYPIPRCSQPIYGFITISLPRSG